MQTTDVLAGLVAARTDPRQILVGFAAETPGAGETLLDLGRAKLARRVATCWSSTRWATIWSSGNLTVR